MKHIIIGGDGFVGQRLAANLAAQGEHVVIADIARGAARGNDTLWHSRFDVTDPTSFASVKLKPDDVVYNLSARMLSPIMLRARRREFFWPVNHDGVRNILEWMESKGASRLVHFTTDMVYGHPRQVPTRESAPLQPLGEYSQSKLESEYLCEEWRKRGFAITIFRPRLIYGPGRLGILSKLFKLIDCHLPVPMIGSGRKPYQFVSVFDCASAVEAAWRVGFPGKVYNLGSDDPPPKRKLLGDLIRAVGSKSILLSTPAPLVKAVLTSLDFINMLLMDPEQYLTADEVCILDTSAAKADLGWKPLHRDQDMLQAAYHEYRAGLRAGRAQPAMQAAE